MDDLAWNRMERVGMAMLWQSHFVDHGVARAWKGLDWDLLDRLHARGWIGDPKRPTKSVVLTADGLSEAKRAFEALCTASPAPTIHLLGVLKLDEERRNIVRKRCWGWFETFAAAEAAMLSNETGIFEDGYYDAGLIESAPAGILTQLEEHWYVVRSSRREGARWLPVVEPTEKPAGLRRTCNFLIG